MLNQSTHSSADAVPLIEKRFTIIKHQGNLGFALALLLTAKLIWTKLLATCSSVSRRSTVGTVKPNDMASYDAWLVDAVELLLKLARDKQRLGDTSPKQMEDGKHRAGSSMTLPHSANPHGWDLRGRPAETVVAALADTHGGRLARSPAARAAPWGASERQAGVVLRERGGRGARSEQVVELGELHLLIEGAVGEGVQQRRHPPGKALGLPHSRQRPAGIVIEACGRLLPVMLDEGLRQIAHVARRQIEALGTGRRHDVGRIARKQ